MDLVSALRKVERMAAYYRTGEAELLAKAADALLEADHAVAIEREAAAKWHEDKSAQCIEFLAEHPEVGENMSAAIRTEGIVHALAAQAIRAGEHHEGEL